MSLCLLRPDKAGDALKTLPALRALKKLLPETPLHLIASHHNESVFDLEPNIKTWTLPKNWESFTQSALQQFLTSQGLPQHFEKVINLLCDPSEAAQLLGSVIHGKYFSISDDPTFSPVHRDETENIALIMAKALNLPIRALSLNESRAPILEKHDFVEAEQLGNKSKNCLWFGLFPIAGTTQRSHPLNKWAHLIRNIQYWSPSAKLFLFGGPNDLLQLEQLTLKAISRKNVSIHSASTFRALGGYMNRFDGVIAVDSGPLHLSLALGIPSLGFLSGGDWQRWFSKIGAKDKLVKRGILQRYPSSFEMSWAFKRWSKSFN